MLQPPESNEFGIDTVCVETVKVHAGENKFEFWKNIWIWTHKFKKIWIWTGCGASVLADIGDRGLDGAGMNSSKNNG